MKKKLIFMILVLTLVQVGFAQSDKANVIKLQSEDEFSLSESELNQSKVMMDESIILDNELELIVSVNEDEIQIIGKKGGVEEFQIDGTPKRSLSDNSDSIIIGDIDINGDYEYIRGAILSDNSTVLQKSKFQNSSELILALYLKSNVTGEYLLIEKALKSQGELLELKDSYGTLELANIDEEAWYSKVVKSENSFTIELNDENYSQYGVTAEEYYGNTNVKPMIMENGIMRSSPTNHELRRLRTHGCDFTIFGDKIYEYITVEHYLHSNYNTVVIDTQLKVLSKYTSSYDNPAYTKADQI